MRNSGGSLTVNNLDIQIDNLSNSSSYRNVFVDASANFSEGSKIKAQWKFDHSNENDEFIFRSEVDNFELGSLNNFSKANFNTEMEGHIDKMYYTISGNKHTSNIDIKSRHSDVKVIVFRKDRKNRNKFFSSVANMMISTNSAKRKSNFISANAQVVRDPTKSVFNYIFRNVQEGLKKIFL